MVFAVASRWRKTVRLESIDVAILMASPVSLHRDGTAGRIAEAVSKPAGFEPDHRPIQLN
jgi:hypothetical protein